MTEEERAVFDAAIKLADGYEMPATTRLEELQRLKALRTAARAYHRGRMVGGPPARSKGERFKSRKKREAIQRAAREVEAAE